MLTDLLETAVNGRIRTTNRSSDPHRSSHYRASSDGRTAWVTNIKYEAIGTICGKEASDRETQRPNDERCNFLSLPALITMTSDIEQAVAAAAVVVAGAKTAQLFAASVLTYKSLKHLLASEDNDGDAAAPLHTDRA